jgi:hypothetical protein
MLAAPVTAEPPATIHSQWVYPGPGLPILPQGIIDSLDAPVAPASLYLEQLRERLGTPAIKNIGYPEPK